MDNSLKQQQEGTSVHVHTFAEGSWTTANLHKVIAKNVTVELNPGEMLDANQGLMNLSSYLSSIINVKTPKDLLLSSDVVGNIRFNRPTLYVFPGCNGDSALFGINGFNLLVNGGYNRKACFWDFTRHLDRIDAMLVTHLGSDNIFGVSSVMDRKVTENVHPEIGYVYMNGVDKKKHSPNGDTQPENGGIHKQPSLVVNLAEEGHRVIENLHLLGQAPGSCIGSMQGKDFKPVNLYHKVGHGTLDMYVLNPMQDSKELKEFYTQWNKNVNSFSSKGGIPLPNVMSVCALLVWRPANANEKITRILFPGNSPQPKIFEGLDKLKTLDIFQHSTCSELSLHAPKPAKKAAGVKPASAPPKRTPPPSTPRAEPKKTSPPREMRTPAKSAPPSKTTKDAKNKKTGAVPKTEKKSPASASPSSTEAKSPVEPAKPLVPVAAKVVEVPVPDVPEIKADETAVEKPVERPAEPTPAWESEPKEVPKPEEPAPVIEEPPQLVDIPVTNTAPEVAAVKEELPPAEPTPSEPQASPKIEETSPFEALTEPAVDSKDDQPAEESIPEPNVQSEKVEADQAIQTPTDAPEALPEPIADETAALVQAGVFEADTQENSLVSEEPVPVKPTEASTTESSPVPVDPESEPTAPVVELEGVEADQMMHNVEEDPPMGVPEPLPDPEQFDSATYAAFAQTCNIPIDNVMEPLAKQPVSEEPSGEQEDEPEAEKDITPTSDVQSDAMEEEASKPSLVGDPVDSPTDAASQDDVVVINEPPCPTNVESEINGFAEPPIRSVTPEHTAEEEQIARSSEPEPEPQKADEVIESVASSVDSSPEISVDAVADKAGESEISQPLETQIEEEKPQSPVETEVVAESASTSEQATPPSPTEGQSDIGLPDVEPEAPVSDSPAPDAVDVAEIELQSEESLPAQAEEKQSPESSVVEDDTVESDNVQEALDEQPCSPQQSLVDEDKPEETKAELHPSKDEANFDGDFELLDTPVDVARYEDGFSTDQPQIMEASDIDTDKHDEPAMADSYKEDGISEEQKPEDAEAIVKPDEPVQAYAENVVTGDEYSESEDLSKGTFESGPLDLDQEGEIDEDSLIESGHPEKSAYDFQAGQPDLLTDMSAAEPAPFQMDASQELPSLDCGSTTNPFMGVSDSDVVADVTLDQPSYIPQSNGHEDAASNMSADPMQSDFQQPHPTTAEDLERDSLERDDPGSSFDPLKDWGQPMGLPAPDNGVPKNAKKTDGASSGAVNGAKKSGTTRSGARGSTPTASATTRKPAADSKRMASAGDARKTTRTATTARKPPTAKAKEEPAKKPASGTATKRPTSGGRPSLGPTSAPQAGPKTATSKGPASKRTSMGGGRGAAPVKAAPLKPVTPFYLDLTYIPNHGDTNYVDVDFFRRVRARYYILSALSPNPAILNSFLDAKEAWEDADAEVTIIPTYDTEVLRQWMALHREKLSQLKVDVAPSASRCTIQLQDHETSCAAYRLEF